MGFFDFIKSKTSTQSAWKKTLIKDLVMLTAIDGEMNKDEIKLVLNIAVNEVGFSEKEFVHLLENLGSIEDVYPVDHEKKLEYMLFLMRMTYSDGFINENEIKYMESIANKMSLPKENVRKAISIIENESLNKSKSETELIDFDEDSSIGTIIITSPFEPKLDMQGEDEVLNYLKRISKLSTMDLCIELSNVMSAKHNLTLMPSGIGTFSNTQKLVTDLTDKAIIICICRFGRENIFEYAGDDIRKFNQLLNDIDAKVARLNLAPAPHGNKMFDEIKKALGV